jgi:hypothetical protein
MTDKLEPRDWKAYRDERAREARKNYKSPRRGEMTPADRPDPSKPAREYRSSERHTTAPRLNPFQQAELAKTGKVTLTS